jgi:serine/threonine protein phosphatase 1
VSTKRTFVVGDLHGCVDELNVLLDAIEPTTDDAICFLGDYVDRGPSSKGVIERLLRLRHEGPSCTFLKGNHEDMFLAYLGYPGHHGEAFLWNGGDVTLESYGIYTAGPADAAAHLPPSHLEFLLALRSWARFNDFLCVHAGLRPTRPWNDQDEEDLLWIREDFITSPHAYPFTVLYGHTPHRQVRIDLPYKIGLDTGLVYGNFLSCLELDSKELFQIRRGRPTVEACSLAGQFEQHVRRRNA